MIFLLSTQTLLDVLSGKESIQNWLNTIPMQQVEISTVSIGQAVNIIQESSNPSLRRNFERQLDHIVIAVRSNQGVIPFDEDAARIWADLLSQDLPYKKPDGSETELSVSSRMVVATALQQGATLVESPQPYHTQISGLAILSP